MRLTPYEPGIRLNVGVSKSGKTFLMRQDLTKAVYRMPIIVLDQTREWNTAPVPAYAATTGKQAIAFVESHRRADARAPHAFVILRPTGALMDAGIALCAWALHAKPLVGLAFPEAHNVFPVRLTTLPPDMLVMLTAYRHFGIAVWFDTQRVALLNTTIRGQATEINVFSISSKADLDAISESVRDRKLFERAIDEISVHYDRGEYGYHVTLGASRRPPYTIVRG